MPWLTRGATSQNPSIAHFIYGSFSARLLLEKAWGANLVQFERRKEEKKACLFYFFFFSFLEEHCLKQNCIMHSSICTNGYFCGVALTPAERSCKDGRAPPWSDNDVTGRGLGLGGACLLRPMYFLTPSTHYYASITAGGEKQKPHEKKTKQIDISFFLFFL